MRALLLSLAVLALPLAGCDSGGDDDDGGGGFGTITCNDVSLLDGSLSGSATTGSVTANCFSVETAGGDLTIVAFDLPSSGAGLRSTVVLDFEEAAEGTYSVGGDDDDSRATYSPSGTSGFDAASGTITLSEFSASRVRGSFDFETINGIDTSGSFTVEL